MVSSSGACPSSRECDDHLMTQLMTQLARLLLKETPLQSTFARHLSWNIALTQKKAGRIRQNQDPCQCLCEPPPVPGPDFQEQNSVLPECHQKPNEELPGDHIVGGEEGPPATSLCSCRGRGHLQPACPASWSCSLSRASSYQIPESKQGCQGVPGWARALQVLKKLGPHPDRIRISHGIK